jgi:uncharacterized protein (DUF952 family)
MVKHQPNMQYIYHITTPAVWAEAQSTGEVVAESLASEGFIHCSRQHQLLGVAERYFPGASGLLVLAIDEQGVAERLVNEGPAGVGDPLAPNIFPHVYSAIPVAAVVAVVPLSAGPDGRYEWPAELPL